MVSFELNSQQQLVQETARRFANNEISPVAAGYDERAEFALPVYQKAFDAGLMNDSVPEKFGGPGLASFETTLIAEELAVGCAGMTTTTQRRSTRARPAAPAV